jgi:hypothetical protein
MTERFFSLGRFAMREALRHCGVGPEDRVMLPSFICRDVLASIAELKARVVYYEVDEHLKPISLDPKTTVKAIVAVNYFGFPQNLEPFNKYCALTGASLIEDNAHGFLSRDENNTPLATRAKFGITSFRKSLNVDDGAILISSLSESEIEPQISFLDSPVSGRTKLIIRLASLQRLTRLPIVNCAQFVSQLTRRIRTGSSLPQSDQSVESVIPGHPAPTRGSISVFQALNNAVEFARRREMYAKIEPRVRAAGVKPVFESLPAFTCPYGLPIYAEAHQVKSLKRIARKNRVTLMKWPDLPTEISPIAPPHYSKVWLLNFK